MYKDKDLSINSTYAKNAQVQIKRKKTIIKLIINFLSENNLKMG